MLFFLIALGLLDGGGGEGPPPTPGLITQRPVVSFPRVGAGYVVRFVP